MTIEQFIERNEIIAKAERRPANPQLSDSQPDDRHWLVTLSRPGRKMAVPFTQGSAHKEDPTAADVLGCLASDSDGYDQARTFEEWASEYGYDTDSRKAERTFAAISQQAGQLIDFLGHDEYQTLLRDVERL